MSFCCFLYENCSHSTIQTSSDTHSHANKLTTPVRLVNGPNSHDQFSHRLHRSRETSFSFTWHCLNLSLCPQIPDIPALNYHVKRILLQYYGCWEEHLEDETPDEAAKKHLCFSHDTAGCFRTVGLSVLICSELLSHSQLLSGHSVLVQRG